MAAAGLAAQADVGAEPVDEPDVAAARMAPPRAGRRRRGTARARVGRAWSGRRVSEARARRWSARGCAPWPAAGRSGRPASPSASRAASVAASWATTPPDAGQRAGQRLPGRRSPGPRTGRRAARPRPTARPAARRSRRPGTTRTSSIAIASAPALRSSLMQLLDGLAARSGPATVIATPGPPTGSRPANARTRREVAAELVDRRLAARLVAGQRRRAPARGRDLAPQLVVAGVEVGDEDGQVLRRHAGERRRRRPATAAGRRRAARATKRRRRRSRAGSGVRCIVRAPRGWRGRRRRDSRSVDGPGEGRHVDRPRARRTRPGCRSASTRARDEVEEALRRRQPVVQVGAARSPRPGTAARGRPS